MLGQASVDGVPASSAMLMIDGVVAELAGVATLPEYRGRGLAGDASARVIAQFFENSGSMVWLAAADDTASSVYSKLGFVPVGRQVNYCLSPD